jgi:hypothetical protein
MAEVLSIPASYSSGGLRRSRPSQTDLIPQSSKSNASSSRKSDKHSNGKGVLSSKNRSSSSPQLSSLGRSRSSDKLVAVAPPSFASKSKQEKKSPPPPKAKNSPKLGFPRFDPLPPAIDDETTESDTDQDSEETDAPPSSPDADDINNERPAPSVGRRTRKLVPFQSEDDSALRSEPSVHVDYLSHEWKEEDVWASWRFIVSQRKIYGEKSRLENASWRSWAKHKNKLKTLHPKKLNW